MYAGPTASCFPYKPRGSDAPISLPACTSKQGLVNLAPYREHRHQKGTPKWTEIVTELSAAPSACLPKLLRSRTCIAATSSVEFIPRIARSSPTPLQSGSTRQESTRAAHKKPIPLVQRILASFASSRRASLGPNREPKEQDVYLPATLEIKVIRRGGFKR